MFLFIKHLDYVYNFRPINLIWLYFLQQVVSTVTEIHVYVPLPFLAAMVVRGCLQSAVVPVNRHPVLPVYKPIIY